MSKATPGPWEPSRQGLFVRKYSATTGDGPKDFNICEMNNCVEGWEANRALIVAAPDLLAALKFIADRENLTFAECTDAEQIIKTARNAIAKAEGTS